MVTNKSSLDKSGPLRGNNIGLTKGSLLPNVVHNGHPNIHFSMVVLPTNKTDMKS